MRHSYHKFSPETTHCYLVAPLCDVAHTLELLAMLVEAYEDVHYPIPDPAPGCER